ncbi:hypothetical protein [Sporosarcina sp. P3]|uniref:hypothetical protein n=1 Tax=Sporosarcina sp. P3 TaxID=2048245 RepID=UPI00117A5032|nr:hypothetical protein [Sporosarcina sp. P3]
MGKYERVTDVIERELSWIERISTNYERGPTTVTFKGGEMRGIRLSIDWIERINVFIERLNG